MASKALRNRFPWHGFRCEGDGCYTCASEGEAIHATLREVRDAIRGLRSYSEVFWSWQSSVEEMEGGGGDFLRVDDVDELFEPGAAGVLGDQEGWEADPD